MSRHSHDVYRAHGLGSAQRLADAEVLHPGIGYGPVVHLDRPLSFWGGVDKRGVIIDVHHPQSRVSVTGSVLVMPSVCGSSSSASVLAELIRRGNAPAAVVLGRMDTILMVGALVAAELYDEHMPIVVMPVPVAKSTELDCWTVDATRSDAPATISAYLRNHS